MLFDQRGVGLSQPALDCLAFNELARELLEREMDGRHVGEEQAADLFLESSRDRRQELAEVNNLSAYNSAADINDLRLALGYQ